MIKIIQKLKPVFLACEENQFKPRILDGDFLFRLVLIFFILKIVVLPFYVYFPKSVFFAKITSSEIFELLDTQRKSQGLSPLKENLGLDQAALLKAQHMFAQDYFGHKSPDGISGWYWIKKAGYDYESAGENLAIGFLDSKEVHKAWNDSQLHRQNLLNPYFEDVGIAVLTGEFEGNETTIVVQLFGKPKSTLAEKIVPPVEAKTEKTEEVQEKEEVPEGAPREEPKEEETLEEPGPEIVVTPGVSPGVTPEITPEQEKTSFQSKFWEFLVKRYDNFIQKVAFLVVSLMALILILNVVAIIGMTLPIGKKLDMFRKIAPASLVTIMLLVLFGAVDKSLIVQLIPHYFSIR